MQSSSCHYLVPLPPLLPDFVLVPIPDSRCFFHLKTQPYASVQILSPFIPSGNLA